MESGKLEYSFFMTLEKDQYLTKTLAKNKLALNPTSHLQVVKEISIFEFDDYSEFLNSYVNLFGKYTHGPYNLTNWSKRLGYRSPSSLTMVLNKQRIPPTRMVLRLAEDFKLTSSETKYFELLVEIEKLKAKGKDFTAALKSAHKIAKKKKYQKIDINHFSLVSDWYCYVLKRLVSCKNFINDIDWIHRALRKKVTKGQIKEGLDRLKTVGLIEEVDGKLRDANQKIHTGDQIPSAAIKNHHIGMIQQALDALQEQSVDNRMFQALILNLNKEEDLKNAFDDIAEFVSEFNAKYSKEESSNSVYQMNIQLFEHTQEVEQ